MAIEVKTEWLEIDRNGAPSCLVNERFGDWVCCLGNVDRAFIRPRGATHARFVFTSEPPGANWPRSSPEGLFGFVRRSFERAGVQPYSRPRWYWWPEYWVVE